MSQLRLDKGRWAGQPLELMPWQDDFTDRLFKLNRKGRRDVQRALMGVARKNGKSGFGAALALTLLVCDGEAGGEIIGAAAKRDQAKLIMETAKRMVRYSKINGKPLSDFLEVRRDAIYFPELDARYIVVSADGEKEHGLNPSAVLIDEWHALGDKRDLIDALTTAQGAREDPLLIGFSTAGPAPRGSLYDEYRYGQQVNGGYVNDPTFLGVWYEAEKEMELDDPEAWRQANPSLGVTVGEEWLAKAAADVISGRSPEYVFRRLHLNQWTSAMERWLSRQKWDECGTEPNFPEGGEIVIALDAALRRDSFGVAWMYRERGWVTDESGLEVPADIANFKVKAFVPEEEGDYTDQEDVRTFLMGLANRYAVTKVVYDPAYMTLFAQQLAESGLPMEPFPQSGERMVRATETFQRLVLQTRARHGADRVLDEQLAGVAVSETERGVRISKRKSNDRIDTVIAVIMCADEFSEEEDSGDFAIMV
jgi:phage terminase large subunit-like protein